MHSINAVFPQFISVLYIYSTFMDIARLLLWIKLDPTDVVCMWSVWVWSQAVDNASLSLWVTSCSSLTQQHRDRKLGQSCPFWGTDTGRAGEWPGQGLGEVAKESGQWEGLKGMGKKDGSGYGRSNLRVGKRKINPPQCVGKIIRRWDGGDERKQNRGLQGNWMYKGECEQWPGQVLLKCLPSFS